MQNGSLVGICTSTHCTHIFACFIADFHAQSAVINQISASEPIKRALLVGYLYLAPPPPPPLYFFLLSLFPACHIGVFLVNQRSHDTGSRGEKVGKSSHAFKWRPNVALPPSFPILWEMSRCFFFSFFFEWVTLTLLVNNSGRRKVGKEKAGSERGGTHSMSSRRFPRPPKNQEIFFHEKCGPAAYLEKNQGEKKTLVHDWMKLLFRRRRQFFFLKRIPRN